MQKIFDKFKNFYNFENFHTPINQSLFGCRYAQFDLDLSLYILNTVRRREL
jgi:hypothetical protein